PGEEGELDQVGERLRPALSAGGQESRRLFGREPAQPSAFFLQLDVGYLGDRLPLLRKVQQVAEQRQRPVDRGRRQGLTRLLRHERQALGLVRRDAVSVDGGERGARAEFRLEVIEQAPVREQRLLPRLESEVTLAGLPKRQPRRRVGLRLRLLYA